MSTRYAEVARTLTAQIGDGTYPVGSLLPKEVNLAQTLGVSRSTVRNALQELQQLAWSRGARVLALASKHQGLWRVPATTRRPQARSTIWFSMAI